MLTGCDSNLPMAETPPPPVTVSQPLEREVTDYDDYEGRIAAVETVDVRARVNGYLVKVGFTDGQLVKKGDLLFEIDPAPYKAALDAAKAQQSAAEAALELAKREYSRDAPLVARGAISQGEMDVKAARQSAATAERLKAIANVEQAKLNLDFTTIEAPISGRTSRTQVTVGNLVNSLADTVLTTIVTVEPMYVYFDVDERSLLRYLRTFGKIKPDDKGARPPIKELKIPLYVALEGEEGYSQEGVIDFADNRVNPSTGTIQVRGVLPNTKQNLTAGMRARVRIPVGEPRKALLITERAVGTDQGLKFVYVVNDKNVAERRDVKLGRLSNGLQIIDEGLKPEDWIVVNGIQRVRDGATVDPKRVPMPGTPVETAKSESKK
jgi:RND family efflux transporter MFP subunit